ncbi:Transposase, MuDR, plant [Corchorus capsularis]|uniref:Transposase, MuDR, plant n=1 Tax=Corchorus capsularis TaxID=210143 RepID=A0A1R3ISB6_COCAP|nr:Transposase, MuDR, plant [Corchorus capsularis]
MAFFEGIVRFRYAGSFVGEGESLRYENGILDELRIDPDRLSKIELEELLKDAGCKNVLNIYYKRPRMSMCRGLKLIENDWDVLDMAGELVEHGEIDIYVVHMVDDPHDAGLDAANDVGLHAENEFLGVENQPLGPGLGENDAGKEGGLENEELGAGEVSIGVENVNLGPADGEKQNSPLPNADGGLENGLGGKDGDINAQDVADLHVEQFSNGCAYFDHVEEDNSDDEDPEIQPIDAAEEVSGLENEAGPSNNFNPEEPYYSTDELGDFDSDDDATRNTSRFPVYNPNNEIPHIEVEMLFTNSDQFKHAVSLESILKKKGIYWVKNSKERVRAKCSDPECPWEIYASFQKSIHSFQVKKFISDHKCNRVLSTPRLSQKMLAQLVSVDIKRDPYIPYIEIIQLVSERYGLDVELSMVKRAKRDVVRSVAANYEKEFASLQAYGEEIKKTNVGSSVWMQCHKDTVESPPLFQRYYICLNNLKRGFVLGCRQFLGLDGCWLKSLTKGELLVAVGRDGNNQMFPIAWALVEVESTDSWKWFLDKLMIDIDFREGYGWVLMTDQMKGLDTAIESMLPMAEHRFCARHMYVNWKKNAEDIEKTPVRQYCRAFLSTDERCDMIDNNMCEAFNGTLLKARKLPVISLFEQIRRRMMIRIAEKRKECTRWKGNLGPNIWKIINKNVDIADKCLVYGNGADGYEILHGEEQFVVHLDNKTCSCMRYIHSGIPCAHAICAIRHKKTNIEDYVSSWYYKEVYQLAYGFLLEPLKGLEDWPTIDGEHEQVHPPAYRRKPGRPKLARRKGAHENESNNRPKPAPTKMSRKGTVMTCQNCHQTGHNKRGCPKTNSGNEGVSIAETNPTNIPANPLNMPTDLPEEVETSHPQSSSRTKLHPKKKKVNVVATVSAAQATATAEVNYTGIGNATFTANFPSSNDVGSSGNATVNITSAQQVPEIVPDNVLETSKGKAMATKASKAKAAAKAKGKTKGKPPRVSGRVVLDESGKVLSTTEPNFRTSPKSKAKLFGNVQGGNASTCNTPTPTPNWFETVSSASTGGLQQASTSSKRPRMEGYGVYINPQGVQIEDVGLITQRVHKIVNKKSKSSSEVHGTQESNNSGLTSKGGRKAIWKP